MDNDSMNFHNIVDSTVSIKQNTFLTNLNNLIVRGCMLEM